MSNKANSFLDWIGASDIPDFAKARWIGNLIGVALAAAYVTLFASLLFGMIWVVLSIPHQLASAVTMDERLDLRWSLLTLAAVTASLGALVALPFTVLKTIYNRRQTHVAEQGHITEQINKAVENLGATRSLRDKDGNEVHTPNLEVRIGGILALERISKASPDDHVQIMEILCAYIRENAPKGNERICVWSEALYALDQFDDNEDGQLRRISYLQLSSGELRKWAGDLPQPTSDIRQALEVIGRFQRRVSVSRAISNGAELRPDLRIDLRGTNLQRANLKGLNFSGALFNGAQLDGADFSGTSLVEVDFTDASLIAARLDNCQISNPTMCEATITAFYGDNADLQDTSLSIYQLWDVFLSRAQYDSAKIVDAWIIQFNDLSLPTIELGREQDVNLRAPYAPRENPA